MFLEILNRIDFCIMVTLRCVIEMEIAQISRFARAFRSRETCVTRKIMDVYQKVFQTTCIGCSYLDLHFEL